MTQKNDDMSALEAHFSAARNVAPAPSDDLFARVLADARAVQADRQPMPAPKRFNPLMQLFDVLGGWPAMGGLTAATVAGLWLGISPPVPLQNLTDGYLGPDATAYLMDTSADVVLGLSEEAM